MTIPAYPKRPKFFANRFVRLMVKTCLANEIGPDGFTFLAVIVHTEDAGGYRKPVSYWNGQLAPLVGVGSESALRRLREKCVESGWLAYHCGAKGKAPTYFVQIPGHFDGVDDGPTSEQESEYSHDELPPDSCSNLNKKAAGKRQESGENPTGKRQESEQHSSLTLTLTQKTEEIAAFPPPAPVPPREKKTRPRNDLFDAVAEVTGSDPALTGPLLGKTAAALAKASPPYTPDDVREFGRRFVELCDYARDRALLRPSPGEVQKYISRIRASPLGGVRTTGPPKGRAETTTEYATRTMLSMFSDFENTPPEITPCQAIENSRPPSAN